VALAVIKDIREEKDSLEKGKLEFLELSTTYISIY
jgi:hypothetical protein